MKAIVKNRDHLPPDTRADLIRNLRKMAKDAREVADVIEGDAADVIDAAPGAYP